MDANFWIKVRARKFHRRWDCGPVQAFKKKPDTAADEIAIQIQLKIPDAFFETPQLSAVVEIPEEAVSKPQISAAVCDNFARALSAQLGVKVHVSTDPPTEEDQID